MAAPIRPALRQWIGPLLILLGVTALGTWGWGQGGREFYGRFFMWAASGIYAALGFDDVMLGPRERFINLIPFVALMLATPGLSQRRRLGGTLAGLLVLFALHVVASFWVSWQFRALVTFPLTIALVFDVMPFALWSFIARDVLSQWIGHSGSTRS